MEDIHTRYKSATRLLLEIRDQLEQLETGENTSDIFESRIAANINDLSRITAQLEGLVGQQTAAQRDIWKIRVGQLREECKALRNSFGVYNEKKAEEQRSKLIGRVNRHTGPTSQEEQMLKEHESLGRSIETARDLENQAKTILGTIADQNQQLRDMLDKVTSMAMTLGMSRTVMRLIERRQYTDKLIVYGGMVFVLLLVFVLYFFVR